MIRDVPKLYTDICSPGPAGLHDRTGLIFHPESATGQEPIHHLRCREHKLAQVISALSHIGRDYARNSAADPLVLWRDKGSLLLKRALLTSDAEQKGEKRFHSIRVQKAAREGASANKWIAHL